VFPIGHFSEKQHVSVPGIPSRNSTENERVEYIQRLQIAQRAELEAIRTLMQSSEALDKLGDIMGVARLIQDTDDSGLDLGKARWSGGLIQMKDYMANRIKAAEANQRAIDSEARVLDIKAVESSAKKLDETEESIRKMLEDFVSGARS
jgi:hypothetical protein